MSELGIRLAQDIRAARNVVWRCLLDAGLRHRWWPEVRVFEGWPGGAFEEAWRDRQGRRKVTRGRILRADPPAVLEMTWADDDWTAQTQVVLSLQDNGQSMRVTLAHRGWEQFSEAEARRLIAGHAAGWEHHLGRLKSFAEALRD